VGPGDEVILPDVTWIASAAPVTYVGATPVFADIDPRSWCLSAAAFEACITPRTKAVIPVDLYGNMPDYTAIRAIADCHGIAVIEDAAQAVGSIHGGAMAGSLGDTGVFSFHGSKTMTTGEGGMLVTDREDLFLRIRALRDHGRQFGGDKMFWNAEVGFKYKMAAVQAALGLAQLERIDELVARKRETFALYARELADMPGITLNAEAPHVRNTYWMVTLILDAAYGLDKETLIACLAEQQIDSRPFFYPLSSLPAYAGQPESLRAQARNTVSYALSPYGINLPSGMDMTAEKVRYVCQMLKQILADQRPLLQ
ncbi:MAG: DegT/DnrJ/EryC1/StrS family aminotransferase, partial [Candidatus Sericytochromatia bacterium]|nr:DegT/DnrJ/EryC1/StrS family aminotransferase [Candidatus Sericytochromatia bacterium]